MGGETSPKTGVEIPGKSRNESPVDSCLPHSCHCAGGRPFDLHRAASSSCLIPLDLDQQFVIVGGFDAGAAVAFVDR